MSISRGPKIIKDNLVLYLDAADKNSYVSGSSTWYDLSGNNNTGSLTNGPTFDSTNQGNIVFDGVNDYVITTTPSNLNLSQSCSINTWVYFNSFSGSSIYPRIIEIQDSNYSIQIIRDDIANKIVTKHSNFQLGTSGSSWFTPVTGSWYNISCVWTPSTSTTVLYLNGIIQSSSSYNDISKGNQLNKITIGVRSDYYSSTFINGKISNVQIYNRALTAAEVLQNYTAVKGRFGL